MDKDKRISPPFFHGVSPVLPKAVPPADTDEWAGQQWRSFDWRSAASLRAPAHPLQNADLVWESTVWERDVTDQGKVSDSGEKQGKGSAQVTAPSISPAAENVAQQLDEIAQRLRGGELSVEGHTPLTPETAMVAALEALIRSQ